MTIKDLKERIRYLDDDMKIGGSGHFGEFLDVYYIEVGAVTKGRFSDDRENILRISMESAGNEPE
jgi:hypothetical protein